MGWGNVIPGMQRVALAAKLAPPPSPVIPSLLFFWVLTVAIIPFWHLASLLVPAFHPPGGDVFLFSPKSFLGSSSLSASCSVVLLSKLTHDPVARLS